MRRLILGCLVSLVALGIAATSASAETLSPWWSVYAGARPTSVSPGATAQLYVTAENLGDAPTSGPVRITDALPKNMIVVSATAIAGDTSNAERGPAPCVSSAGTVTCTFGEYENSSKEVVKQSLPAFEVIEVFISVKVLAGVSGEESYTATVTGGGAPRAAGITRQLQVGASEAFGIETYSLLPEGPGGSIDTQAGSHPFQLTSMFALNQAPLNGKKEPEALGLAKDLVAELPAGMFGNPTPFTQCTDAQFSNEIEFGDAPGNECPAASAIGVATVQFTDPSFPYVTNTVPIFNMTPLAGEPARFAFKVAGLVSVYLDTSVQSGGDYAVRVGAHNLTEVDSLESTRLTFWGVPGAEAHDAQRGWECLSQHLICAPSKTASPPPFLVLPTSCTAPFASTLYGDTWASSEHPSETAQATYTLPYQIDGCNHLEFEPQIGVLPDKPDASTASGLTVDVHVPQEAALNPEGLAESTLKDTTVALPEGVAINPSGGDGLEGCSEGLVGFTGVESGGLERDLFTPRLPGSHASIEAGEEAPLDPGVNFCADESKIATVDDSYAAVGACDRRRRLPRDTEREPVRFADRDVLGRGRPRVRHPAQAPRRSAPLPSHRRTGGWHDVCGCWADPDDVREHPGAPVRRPRTALLRRRTRPAGEPRALRLLHHERVVRAVVGQRSGQLEFDVRCHGGPNGGACPGAALPFSPSLAAGTLGIEAGAFSPLTTTISRGDGSRTCSR